MFSYIFLRIFLYGCPPLGCNASEHTLTPRWSFSFQRLKLYNKVPTNGLVLYCGTVLTDEGKEKQVTILLRRCLIILCAFYPCTGCRYLTCSICWSVSFVSLSVYDLHLLIGCSQVTIDFEPFKPINTSLYLCDNKFHVEVRRLHSVFVFLSLISCVVPHVSPVWDTAHSTPLSRHSNSCFCAV